MSASSGEPAENPSEQRPLLVSIQPRFADAILDGSKTVELRRTRVAAPEGSLLVLYATAPIMAVVGLATLHHRDTDLLPHRAPRRSTLQPTSKLPIYRICRPPAPSANSSRHDDLGQISAVAKSYGTDFFDAHNSQERPIDLMRNYTRNTIETHIGDEWTVGSMILDRRSGHLSQEVAF